MSAPPNNTLQTGAKLLQLASQLLLPTYRKLISALSNITTDDPCRHLFSQNRDAYPKPQNLHGVLWPKRISGMVTINKA